MSALEADTAAVSGMSRILVALIFCILISIQDIRAYRIPNELVYAFFLILFVSDIKYDYSGIIGNISAGVLIFLLFSGVRYFYGGLGGGDAKFGGVLGYTLGLRYSWLSFFAASVLGLVYIIVMRGIGKRTEKVAFAPFLSTGAIGMLVFEVFG